MCGLPLLSNDAEGGWTSSLPAEVDGALQGPALGVAAGTLLRNPSDDNVSQRFVDLVTPGEGSRAECHRSPARRQMVR